MAKTNFKIVQIIPAFNWYAQYTDPNPDEDGDISIELVPVIAWALGSLDSTGDLTIHGMIHVDARIVAAETVPNFSGYDTSATPEMEIDLAAFADMN